MNKGGNPGYGKMEFIRTNVDKFSPKFWELMGEYADSKDTDKEKFFMSEFNKIQAKMIPQVVAGDSENPIPILNLVQNAIPRDNSDDQAETAQETD